MISQAVLFFLALISCLNLSSTLLYSFAASQKLLVSVPVANILTEPRDDTPHKPPVIRARQVPTLKTQVLLGERLRLVRQEGSWLYVTLLEQCAYNQQKKLEGIDGWINKNYVIPVDQYPFCNLVTCNHNVRLEVDGGHFPLVVSLGTKLVGEQCDQTWWRVRFPTGLLARVKKNDVFDINQHPIRIDTIKNIRALLLLIAHRMKGQPFCWYGRSSFNAASHEQLTSMGCDGLVNLLYRAVGLELPRFAKDQLEGGIACHGKDLQPGDLIFFVSTRCPLDQNPHAMVYIGNGMLLEATYQSLSPSYPARIISCTERLKVPISLIFNGQNFGSYRVYFCSYLCSLQKLVQLQQRAKLCN